MSVIKVQRIETFGNFLDGRRRRIMVLFGGAGSGKSMALAQLFIRRLYEEDNIRMLVIRKTLPALKITSYRLILDLLDKYQLPYHLNKTELFIRYQDSEILFRSLDDREKIKCFTPDTEILTKDGFKSVALIKKGDIVATFNPDTREGLFAPVNKTWCYDYDGSMVTPLKDIRQRYIDFCVTPEHKMLCRKLIHHTNSYTKSNYKFVPAKDVGRSLIPRTAIWSGEMKTEYTIPDINGGFKPTTFPIIPWLKFLGWYLSEGCLASAKNHEIYISQTKEEGRKQLKEDLKDFPYKIWGTDDFRLAGKSLYRYLLSLGKYAQNKRIPRDVLNLHPTLLRYIFDTLIHGDGHRTNTGRRIFGSTSKGLIDDISEIAIKLGLVPTVWEVDTSKPSFYPNAKRFWQVSMSKRDETMLEKVTSVPYTGKVYGIEVPPYHTVLIRYGGRVMWCGQSYEANYIWIEEATELSYEDFMQLLLRMRRQNNNYSNQMYLSFNPISPFLWTHTQLINTNRKDMSVHHSTYLDNPFLSPDYIKQLEDLKDQDETMFRIYTLGEAAELKNLIYTNYGIHNSFPTSYTKTIYGLDFGFNVPTALLQIGFKDGQPWLEEKIYQTHLTNQDLIALLRNYVEAGSTIYADAAEPARIEEIKAAGFNILPGIKSVRDGIDYVKRQQLRITASSTNLISEIQGYKWKEDRNGTPLDEPLKFRDHLLDALRYALYTDHLKIQPQREEIILPRLH